MVKFNTLLLIIVLLLVSCNKDNNNKTDKPRIVSCALVADEILLELGLSDEILAFSSLAKDHKYSIIASNPLVKSKKSTNLSNLEYIASLKPSLVIVSEASNKSSLEQLAKLNIATYIIKTPATFDELYSNITNIGTILGKKQEASTLISKLKIQEIEMVSHLLEVEHSRKTILLYGSGGKVANVANSLNEIVTKAGLINMANTLDGLAKYGMLAISNEKLLQLNPDYLLINSLDSSLAHLQSHPSLSKLTGLQDNNRLLFSKEEELKLYSISHYMLDAMWVLHKKIYDEK